MSRDVVAPFLELDLEVSAGDFSLELHERIPARSLALVGPSGAGKTTILEVTAGLRQPRRGRVTVAGRVLYDSAAGVDLPARRRQVGYVPQDLALFPHLDVRRNVLFAAAGHGSPRVPGAVPSEFERVVDVLGLAPLLERRIETLSGGERQRVAIGRALLSSPALLLLDEPLAALHTSLRQRILADLQRVRDELAMPLVYVSHDAAEVRAIAEWVIVLGEGRVTASGPTATVLAS